MVPLNKRANLADDKMAIKMSRAGILELTLMLDIYNCSLRTIFPLSPPLTDLLRPTVAPEKHNTKQRSESHKDIHIYLYIIDKYSIKVCFEIEISAKEV